MGMKRLRQKLHSQSGFTLTELFATIVILLLVAGVVAGGVPAAVRAYEQVVDGANAQLLLSTTMTVLRDELGQATCADDSAGTSVTTTDEFGVEHTSEPRLAYHSGNLAATSQTAVTAEIRSTKEGIRISEHLDVAEERRPTGWSRPLVSESAATKPLHTEFSSITYDAAAGVFTVRGLTVWKGTKRMTEPIDCQVRAISAIQD